MVRRAEEADRVLGLDSAPMNWSSFLREKMHAPYPRVGAPLVRHLGPPTTIVVGGSLSTPALAVTLDGRDISLTTTRVHLWRALVERRGRALRDSSSRIVQGSRRRIVRRAVDVRISRSAQSWRDPKQPRLIRTIRGAATSTRLDKPQ